MASPTGGQFILGPNVAIALNPGTGPTFPPVLGATNIEVFTSTNLATVPPPDAGFQGSILDPNGTIVPVGTGGALTGNNLVLGGGNYTISDQVSVAGRSGAAITLTSGSQRVVGAGGDTLIGGSGTGQVLDAIQNFASGAESIVGGSTADTIFGAPGSTVVGGTNTYIDGTAGQMAIAVGSSATGVDTIFGTNAANTISGAASSPDTLTGGSGAVYVQALGKGDIVNFANQSGNATVNANTALNATPGGVSVTLGSGGATVYGGIGDTINLGSASQYADGATGKNKITLGSGGTDAVFGSNVAGGADTFVGGGAALDFNVQSGGGDLINLSGSSASATVNAYKNGATEVANVNDTIMAGTGTDSVWGGQGDRIGVGTSTSAGGSHTFWHSTSIAGAAVAFGTNDAAVGKTSNATATVTGFNTATDTVFYASRATSIVDAAIVASASSSGGNTTITLPDGTTMTFLGVASAALLKFTA